MAKPHVQEMDRPGHWRPHHSPGHLYLRRAACISQTKVKLHDGSAASLAKPPPDCWQSHLPLVKLHFLGAGSLATRFCKATLCLTKPPPRTVAKAALLAKTPFFHSWNSQLNFVILRSSSGVQANQAPSVAMPLGHLLPILGAQATTLVHHLHPCCPAEVLFAPVSLECPFKHVGSLGVPLPLQKAGNRERVLPSTSACRQLESPRFYCRTVGAD